MNKKIIIIVIISVLVLSNLFLIYHYVLHKDELQEDIKGGELYICPMHPQIQQDHPGTCPICGMELVLKDSGEKMDGMNNESPDSGHGEITLSPSQQVMANVKTQIAELTDFENSIEANGEVKLRDDATRQISAPVKGKITKLYINYEGQRVARGQKAFELYSPELIATQREFLLAYDNYQRAQESSNIGIKESAQSVLNAAKQRLMLWFVDDEQINELMETKQVKNSLTYFADYGGVVTKKYYNEGSWVMEGTTILDVVNLSSVWIIANIYESEIKNIRTGQSVSITFSGFEGKILNGRIDYINPFVNTDTRTIEVRITAPNVNSKLKPGMYVKVIIRTEKKYLSIVLPKTAVLRTGKMDMVYIKKFDNIFAPRQVVIGGEKDGNFLITSGIDAGDEVVVSAGFLIDSENQIRMGSGSNMPGMDMQDKKNDTEIKEGDVLKDMNQHNH
jgi:Cu(I)/Ag(I) efflux system membrane fusion protein